MIAIKKDKAVLCSYKDYACRERSCPFNVLHETKESFLAICDISTDRCLYIEDMIHDDKFDVTIRVWAEKVFVNKECRGLPPKAVEFVERMVSELKKGRV